MKVKVLIDGIYNSPRHKARRARQGDIIEVAGGPYGRSLVADNLVQPLDEGEAKSLSTKASLAIVLRHLAALTGKTEADLTAPLAEFIAGFMESPPAKQDDGTAAEPAPTTRPRKRKPTKGADGQA